MKFRKKIYRNKKSDIDLNEDVRRILHLLERLHPVKETTLLGRIHEKIQGFLKYIGLPALIIASIIPVYELSKNFSEYRNRKYIRGTYIEYSNDLLKRGEFDRAKAVLSGLEDVEKHDAATQYALARTLLEAAYNSGRSYLEAEDKARILLELHDGSPMFFPSIGGKGELLDLHLRLVDILTQRTAYDEGVELLDDLVASFDEVDLDDPKISIRRAKILVFQRKFAEAKSLLGSALKSLENNDFETLKLKGQAHHALANISMFKGESLAALKEFGIAEDFFRKVGDDHGLLRTFANQAIVYSRNRDWEQSQIARIKQVQAARSIKDDLGVANAQIGLSYVERSIGNYKEALKVLDEAEVIFKENDDHLGIGSVYQNRANVFRASGEDVKAIVHARRALAIAEEIRHVSLTRGALGILGDSSLAIENWEDAIYGKLGSIVLLRHSGKGRTKGGVRDLGIHLSQLEDLYRDMGGGEFRGLISDSKERLEVTRRRLELVEFDYSLPFLLDNQE